MRVAELSWVQYEHRISRDLVVLPVGAVEGHGPHLPLSTDSIIASYLAERVEAHIDALVLPALAYGHKSMPMRTGGVFPGVTNLRATTLTNVILDVLTASYGHGARRFLVLHAHMANLPIAFEAIDIFLTQAVDARVMSASWWDFTPDDGIRRVIAGQVGVDQKDDHHAAMVETSLMLAIAPELVQTDLLADDESERRVRYCMMPLPTSQRTRHGVVFKARGASADVGSALIDEIVERLVEAVRLELLGAAS